MHSHWYPSHSVHTLPCPCNKFGTAIVLLFALGQKEDPKAMRDLTDVCLARSTCSLFCLINFALSACRSVFPALSQPPLSFTPYPSQSIHSMLSECQLSLPMGQQKATPMLETQPVLALLDNQAVVPVYATNQVEHLPQWVSRPANILTFKSVPLHICNSLQIAWLTTIQLHAATTTRSSSRTLGCTRSSGPS